MESKTTNQSLVILRRKQVEARTAMPRSSMYAAIKAGTFPAPISLGEKSVGWLEHEIDTWISSRVSISREQRGQS